MNRLAPDSAAYNVSFAVRIRSEVDISALQRTFQQIVDRHPSLRTTYIMKNDGPVQQIHPESKDFFEIIEASAWNEEAIYNYLLTESRRPFDLENGPVIRVTNLLRHDCHILLLNIHHIATDLWSFSLILDELDQLYPKAGTEKNLRISEQASYSDYVRWQAKMLSDAEGERLWNYWKQRLSGQVPILNLPTDFPRPAVQTYNGDVCVFEIDKSPVQKLKSFSRSSNTTLFVTILTGFQILLHRYTGQDDILTGAPAAGRTESRVCRGFGLFCQSCRDQI